MHLYKTTGAVIVYEEQAFWLLACVSCHVQRTFFKMEDRNAQRDYEQRYYETKMDLWQTDNRRKERFGKYLSENPTPSLSHYHGGIRTSLLLLAGLVKENDTVLLTKGTPIGKTVGTNTIRIFTV